MVRKVGKIEFIARSRERTPEAQALVAGCPAEESPLTSDECLTVSMALTSDDDLELRFAVFEALCDRFVRQPLQTHDPSAPRVLFVDRQDEA